MPIEPLATYVSRVYLVLISIVPDMHRICQRRRWSVTGVPCGYDGLCLSNAEVWSVRCVGSQWYVALRDKKAYFFIMLALVEANT